MAWNKPSTENQKKKPSAKAPSAKRGIIAGAVVVVALCALYLWVFSDGDDVPAPSTKHKSPGAIKAVVPAAVPKYEVDKRQEKIKKAAKPEKPIWERPIPEGLDENSREAWKRKMAYEKKLATDERLRRYLAKAEKLPSIYKTGTEQILDWIFTAKVGDQIPPPLPQISPFEENHIEEMLDSVNEIKDDDDENMRERKRIVDEVKKELKDYIKQGGTVQGFLEHYRNELVAAQEMKNMVAREIGKEIRESKDSETSIQFIEKANKTLEDRGITAVELTESQKEALADGLANGKGKDNN